MLTMQSRNFNNYALANAGKVISERAPAAVLRREPTRLQHKSTGPRIACFERIMPFSNTYAFHVDTATAPSCLIFMVGASELSGQAD